MLWMNDFTKVTIDPPYQIKLCHSDPPTGGEESFIVLHQVVKILHHACRPKWQGRRLQNIKKSFGIRLLICNMLAHHHIFINLQTLVREYQFAQHNPNP